MAKLGASNALHDSEVLAANWMTALRAARETMGERPNVPPGASCSIDEHGIATVLDPDSRRKFVLTPLGAASPSQAATPEPPAAKPAATAPVQAPAQVATQAPRPAKVTPPKAKRFQTVALVPNERRAPAKAAIPSGPAAHAARIQKPQKPRFQTGRKPGSLAPGGRIELKLLLERTEEPTAQSPLLYCEKAYLIPDSSTVPEAEAAVRWALAGLQKQLESRPRGKLINLAVFDHHWSNAPERPPLVVLQWRDWKGDITVDYPAALDPAARPSAAPAESPSDDRLADVFEALEELAHLRTPVEGLDLAVRILEQSIPSEATSACLYDINTDELRFVSVLGNGSAGMQGQAVARGAGLFAQAVRAEHDTSVFSDLMAEAAFDVGIDSRPEVDALNVALRPIVHERQLLGMLQLINRKQASAFSAEDVHVLNYLAERLADFLHGARANVSPPAH